MWTYPQVKVADAALSPTIADPVAAATALNAQTVVLPPQNIALKQATNILLLAGDWAKIILRSRGSISDPNAPTAADLAVLSAISASEMLRVVGEIILASDTATWTAFATQLNSLSAVGDVSAASAMSIEALRTPIVPAWNPPVTDQDVLAARGLS